jgi:hypothetical protein
MPTNSDSGVPNDVLREQWARDLKVRIEEARHRMAIACAERSTSPGDTTALGKAAQAVETFLNAADDAIKARPRGRSLLDHWRGLSVVTAYESVHLAETFLVDLLSSDEIRTLVPSVVARAQATLDPDDPRRQEVDRLKEDETTGDAMCPVRFKQAMRAGFQAEDQIHARIRALRNLVVKCTALLFVLMAVMTWLVAYNPESMPLCFSPGASTICPSGDNAPKAEDVLIITGLGLLGGAVAAAFSIRRVQGIPTPYEIPIALAFFKLPLGAFTAVTGLMLLGGNFVPGFSQLDNQRQILAYALAFGYSQQLMSRLLDERVRAIVSRLPHAGPATAQITS